MCLAKNICPVPFDQQPLNEFYALKTSCFFSFFGFTLDQYLYSIFSICLFSVFCSTPSIILSLHFSWSKILIHESYYIVSILSISLIRLYLGWSYIIDRLFSATVLYEESGWYDGQIWIKTPEILIKDRLIGTYYILPLLKRIKFTFAILATLITFEFFLYNLLC